MSNPPRSVIEALDQAESFLVLAHANPDGDAIGSTVAMGWILKRLGKEVWLYNESGLPERFDWLDLPAPLEQRLPDQAVDLVLVLDCGDQGRTHSNGDFPFDPLQVLNIDHHLGNPGFGTLNWVDPKRSSVGEMVALLAKDCGLSLDGPLGQAIYLAMATDTGWFGFSNTGPQTLRLAADIVESGLDPSRIQAKLEKQLTLPRLHLQGLALQQARTRLQGRLAIVSVTKEMFAATETAAEDCEGLVMAMRNIKGVWAGISLREDQTGLIKLSLRSWGDKDVQTIAAAFGGGGHRNAAGASLSGPLAEVEQRLVDYIQKAWAIE